MSRFSNIGFIILSYFIFIQNYTISLSAQNLDNNPSKTASSPRKKGLLIKADDPEDAKRWAIVIGVNDYNDVGIQDLSKARNDAKIMGQILMEQGEFEKVFVMTDDVGAKDPLYPTRINIEEKLDILLTYAHPYDTILFYFSGHGISDESGNGYILPVDTVMDKVNYTSIKVDQIIKKLNEKKITKSLIVLDACRDVVSTTRSANKEGLQADKFQNAEVGATFFSTKAGYYSFEDPASDFGVFTKYMAYGMEGKADENGDGIVTFGELEDYVQREVNNWSLANNKKQKPFVKYFKEKYGDLPITVKGVREKSLVEKNDYNQEMSGYLWRSALIPGWGQWKKDQPIKAGIFFGTTLLGLGLVGAKYHDYNSKIEEYNNTSNLYQPVIGSLFEGGITSITSSAFLYQFFTTEEVRAQKEYIKNTANQINGGLGLLFFLYVANLQDAYLSTPQTNKSKGLGMNFHEYGTLNFDVRPEFNTLYTTGPRMAPQYILEYSRSF